jgi:hypothetical protein
MCNERIHPCILNLVKLDAFSSYNSGSNEDVKLSSNAANVSLWSLYLLYVPQQQGYVNIFRLTRSLRSNIIIFSN